MTASAVDAARSKAAAAVPDRSEENDGKEAGGSACGATVEASFLRDISKRVHGIAGSEEAGDLMANRIARNRHTNQRQSDAFL